MWVVGDYVRKIKGYKFPGVVRSVFMNTAGEWKVVVEARHDDFKGMLHIYNPDQLELDNV